MSGSGSGPNSAVPVDKKQIADDIFQMFDAIRSRESDVPPRKGKKRTCQAQQLYDIQHEWFRVSIECRVQHRIVVRTNHTRAVYSGTVPHGSWRENVETSRHPDVVRIKGATNLTAAFG
jgi:hypothetical protein